MLALALRLLWLVSLTRIQDSWLSSVISVCFLFWTSVCGLTLGSFSDVEMMLKVLREKLGSSCWNSKELQINKAISIQAKFISAKRLGNQHLGGQRPAGQGFPHVAREPREQVLCSEDLYSWRGGGEGITCWLMGKGSAKFPPGRCDYPNVGMCGGLLAQIFILLQTLFVHFVYMMGGRQLTKAVFMGYLSGHCRAPPFPLLSPGINAVSRFSFSRLVERMPTDFQGLPLHALCYHGCAGCSECVAVLLNKAQDYGVNGWDTSSFAPCTKLFVRL